MKNLTPALRLVTLAAIAGGVVSLAVPAGASAADVALAAAPGSCYFYDNINNMPGACDQETANFSEGGVSIWNDPSDPTAMVGTGAAGQVFKTLQYVSQGALYSCDNGVQTRYWYQGEAITGQNYVTGWVPDCYLNGEPT